MTTLLVFCVVAILVVLIAVVRLHAFLAFIITAIVGALLLGIPVEQVPMSIQKGMGDMLSSVLLIICLGAMFGKLVSESGAAQKIAQVLLAVFGRKHASWALMLAGFIVGIPLFYNVGFVLLVPLVFSVAYQSRLPIVSLGIPLLAALSVTHGFLPPHPSPTAMVGQFGAEIGQVLLLGIIVALPTMIVAGPILARAFTGIQARPMAVFDTKEKAPEQLPSLINSFGTALLPALLIGSSLLLPVVEGMPGEQVFKLFASPSIAMVMALAVATYSLGLARGISLENIMTHYSSAIKDISVVLMIVAGAGALKQVLVDSGVSADIGSVLAEVNVNPLIVGWLTATAIRIALGSATVAGLTTAGLLAPLIESQSVNPNLMVLAIGAGSLMCSHVNDSGFWMYKEYFNLNLKQTFMSWTVMETVVGVCGITFVYILDVVMRFL